LGLFSLRGISIVRAKTINHLADTCALNPKTEIGRDGALRRPRAVQARNNFGQIDHRGSIRSARCTRTGTAQRAFPTVKS
jgi:hypothetical protein